MDGIYIDIGGVFMVEGHLEVYVCERSYGDLKCEICPEMSIARGRYIPDMLCVFANNTWVEEVLVSKYITKAHLVTLQLRILGNGFKTIKLRSLPTYLSLILQT